MSEAPKIQDDPGKADEYFARLILILPFASLFVASLGFVIAIMRGMIVFNVSITGSLSIQYIATTFLRPFAFAIVGIMAGIFILAAAKEWGIKPVSWLGNMARNYNPPEDKGK